MNIKHYVFSPSAGLSGVRPSYDKPKRQTRPPPPVVRMRCSALPLALSVSHPLSLSSLPLSVSLSPSLSLSLTPSLTLSLALPPLSGLVSHVYWRGVDACCFDRCVLLCQSTNDGRNARLGRLPKVVRIRTRARSSVRSTTQRLTPALTCGHARPCDTNRYV